MRPAGQRGSGGGGRLPPLPWGAAGALGGLCAVAALLLLSGGAQAYHSNPTCLSGSYTQTWNAEVVVISPQTPIVDECILVQANITVQSGGELRFRDSQLVFDNNLGNFTLLVEASGLVEFRDDDGSPSTNDRSWLGVLNSTITWSSFFFGSAPGARVYVNDTDILGGGVPGAGLSIAGALFMEGPADFSWDRVTHETASSGLVLTNYTRGLTIRNYTVSSNVAVPFAYGLVLERCSNVTITGYLNPQSAPGATAVHVVEGQDIFVRNSTARTASIGFSFLLTSRVVIEDTVSIQHGDTGFRLELVEGAVLNRLLANPTGITGRYGVRIISSHGVEARDLELRRHDTGDLSISGTSRWVNVTNALMTQVNTGSGIRIQGAGAANDAADITFRNVTVAGKGPAGGFAVSLERANRVVFEGYTITGSAGRGLRLDTSSSVWLFNGSVTTNAQGVGFSNSGDVVITNSALSNNLGGGLTVAGGSFLIENVSMTGNGGWSIQSSPPAQMTGDSAVRNSTLEGVLSDAVYINLGSGATATLTVSDTEFVRASPTQQAFLALNLEGFARVTVVDSMLHSFGVRVARSGDVTINRTTVEVVLFPSTMTLLRFDNVSNLVVEDVRFTGDPLASSFDTIINTTALAGDAAFRSMSFPRALDGILVAGRGGSFSPTAAVSDITMTATRDGVPGRALTQVHVDRLRTYRTDRSVFVDSIGLAQLVHVANSTLQAASVGVQTASDTAAQVRIVNITFDRTNSTPSSAVIGTRAQDYSVSGVSFAGSSVGLDLLDVRYARLTDVDFSDNTWGLRQRFSLDAHTDLNWTVSRATTLSNTHLLLRGDIWVMGVPFRMTAGSTIEVFSTYASTTPTRFHFEGASSLSANSSSRVSARPGVPSDGTADARFTMELSSQATVSARDSVFDGLGLLGNVPLQQKGFYLQAADTAFTNVSFLNTAGGIRATRVNVTVTGGTFSGVNGQDLSIDIANARLVVQLGTHFLNRTDGVRVTDGTAQLSNLSFDGVGTALAAVGSTVSFIDSTVAFSSEALRATSSSNFAACRLTFVSLNPIVTADTASNVHVCDSASFNAYTDAKVTGGALVEFDNVFLDRVDPTGRIQYVVDAPTGTFRAYWSFSGVVTSCPVGSGQPIAGVSVRVVDRQGTIVFEGTSDATGHAGPIRLLHYENVNNVESYHAPFSFTAAQAQLSNTIIEQANQTADVGICLDDTPPEILIILPEGWSPPNGTLPPTRNLSIAIRGSSWDNVSGLAQGYPCIAVGSGSCDPVPSSFDKQYPLREGMNTFTIRSQDMFGNQRMYTISQERDNTGPELVACDPPFLFTTPNPTVDLTCQLRGSPQNMPTISGVSATGVSIDLAEVLHATITLREGQNIFHIILQDALGNTNTSDFSWTLDHTPPAPVISSGYNQTVARQFGVFLKGTVPADTASVEWEGHNASFAGGVLNLEWTNLTEGRNERQLRITDLVGNDWSQTYWIDVDLTTNCTVFTPDDNEHRTIDTVVIGGSCDPDVTIVVSGLVGALTPDADGYWSGTVQLHSGPNVIRITFQDSHDVVDEAVRTVYLDQVQGEGIPFLFIILIIVAAGIFGAAVFIMRRPRRPPPEPPMRPMTGSQKAPPRPKPPSLRLPELPEDRRYQPPPPPPPLPPPPPTRPRQPPRR